MRHGADHVPESYVTVSPAASLAMQWVALTQVTDVKV